MLDSSLDSPIAGSTFGDTAKIETVQSLNDNPPKYQTSDGKESISLQTFWFQTNPVIETKR